MKNLPAVQETLFDPWVRKIPLEEEMATHSSIFFFFTPVFLPGIFHGQRSLAGNSSWGCKESHTTE